MKLKHLVKSILQESVKFGGSEKAEVMSHEEDFRVGFEFEMHLQEEYGPLEAWRDQFDYLSVDEYKASDAFRDYISDMVSQEQTAFYEEVISETQYSVDQVNDYGNEADVLINFLKRNNSLLNNINEIVRTKDFSALSNTDELTLLYRLSEVANELEDYYDWTSITTDLVNIFDVLDEAEDKRIVSHVSTNLAIDDVIPPELQNNSAESFVWIYRFFDAMKDLERLQGSLIVEQSDARWLEGVENFFARKDSALRLAAVFEACQDLEITETDLDGYFGFNDVDYYIEELGDHEIEEIAINMNISYPTNELFIDDNEYALQIENLISGSGFEEYVWRVDTDSSVSKGGEIITKPVPLSESLIVLDKVLEFIKRYGDTSNETGLHINMSIDTPGFDFVVDPLRLMLLMDSKHMADTFIIRNSSVERMTRRIVNAWTLENAAHSFTNSGMQGLIDYTRGLVPQDKYWQINFAHMKGYVTTQDDYDVEGLRSERRIEFRFPGGAGYETRGDVIEHHLLRSAYMLLVLFHGRYEYKDFVKDLYRFWNDVADRVFGVSFDRVIQAYRRNNNLDDLTGQYTTKGYDNHRRYQ